MWAVQVTDTVKRHAASVALSDTLAVLDEKAVIETVGDIAGIS